MSWGYWGIVGGLVAMVGMLLACFTLLYPKGKESRPTQSKNPNVPSAVASHTRAHRRKAA